MATSLLVARGVSKRNVFHVADRISVLRLGRHVATFERRTTAREDVVTAITGARPAEAVAA